MIRRPKPVVHAKRRPKQARSEVTRQRFIAAMQELLEQYEYADVTVERIAAAAHSTAANFYKHFAGKRELLSVMVDELQSAARRDREGISLPRSKGLPLAKRVAFLVAAVAGSTLRRRRILRACIAARYQADLVLSTAQTEHVQAMMKRMVDWLLERSSEMDRDNPALAVRAGTYLALQGLQNALLFEELPADLPASVLVQEAEHMLLRFLTTPKP